MAYLIPQKDKDSTSQNYWRAKYARDFIEGDYWMGLGMTDTSWADETNPKDATVGTAPIEVLGYKKVDFKTIAVPDPTGSLRWRNLRFRQVDSKDMFKKICGVYPRWAIVKATITTSELPVNKYFRQVFLYQDLEPDSQHSNLEALTPNQVETPGNLIWIENIEPMYRLSTSIEDIYLLFEF